MRIGAAPTANNPWLGQPARILARRAEVPGVSTYELEFEDPALVTGFRFLPGQFNMLYLPGFGEAAISISSDPATPERLGHTIRIAGNVTRELSRRALGDQLLVRGPYGSSWPLDSARGMDLVIACGGIGLAPLRPALYQVQRRRDDFGRVVLLYGARTPADLLYSDEFAVWRAADIQVEVTVDLGTSDWSGQIGVVPTLFHRFRLQPQRTRVLTCGPEIMMRFVAFEALARQVPAEQIYISLERNMNCAVGLCGHCQFGPAFVCTDGPIFSYARMEPYLQFEDL